MAHVIELERPAVEPCRREGHPDPHRWTRMSCGCDGDGHVRGCGRCGGAGYYYETARVGDPAAQCTNWYRVMPSLSLDETERRMRAAPDDYDAHMVRMWCRR